MRVPRRRIVADKSDNLAIAPALHYSIGHAQPHLAVALGSTKGGPRDCQLRPGHSRSRHHVRNRGRRDVEHHRFGPDTALLHPGCPGHRVARHRGNHLRIAPNSSLCHKVLPTDTAPLPWAGPKARTGSCHRHAGHAGRGRNVRDGWDARQHREHEPRYRHHHATRGSGDFGHGREWPRGRT